ncbi:MAG TPA: peptidylprolyl isomerase [Verrucomicrobiae bacterium]|nr:peptidylprolyl isomerase [Verrucomicrobiae bacterium]
MKLKAVVLLLAVAFAHSACGENKAKPAPSEPAKPGTTTTTAPTVATSAVATQGTNQVVARVGDDLITSKELDFAMQGLRMQMARRGSSVPPGMMVQFQHDMLEELISRELVLQEGRAHPPADIDDKVKKQVTAVQARFGGEEAMLKALQDSGVTKDEYLGRLHDEIIIQYTLDELVEREVKVKPEDVKDFYDKNPDKFVMPETVRASHILVRVPSGASDEVKSNKLVQIKAARSLVVGGDKFADIAKKVSEDPGSAAQGGDLGYFQRGQMVPEFDQAAFSLKTNEVSDIITTQFGYHIIVVTDRKPAGERSFDDVKSDIEKYLTTAKGRDVVQQHVKELRDKAKVEILLPQPPAVSLTPNSATAPAAPPRSLPPVETAPVAAPTK